MFTSLNSSQAKRVSVSFGGKQIHVLEGLSIAAALLEAGVSHFRDTPVSASARAPFCMMGACFDCVLIIDGMPNQQSCMIQIHEGMVLERQPGVAELLLMPAK